MQKDFPWQDGEGFLEIVVLGRFLNLFLKFGFSPHGS